jgi:hypothetical protein
MYIGKSYKLAVAFEGQHNNFAISEQKEGFRNFPISLSESLVSSLGENMGYM